MSTDAQVDRLSPDKPRNWLEFPVTDSRPKIRPSAYGGGKRDCAEGHFELTNLTPKEIEALHAFVAGGSYVRCVNGRLHAYDAYTPLPTPIDDPLIGPHWDATEHKELGGIPAGEGWHSPGIIISHVGAGSMYGDPQRSIAILEECGFICLRSRRGTDGKYWEQWVLHSLSFATGRLKEHMDGWRDKKQRDWHREVEEAARFITRDLQVAFGTLDITIHRWALTYDD